MRIGLNGYGQVGQLLVERLGDCPGLELVAVNDARRISPEEIAATSAQIAGGLGRGPALTAGPDGAKWRGQPVRWTVHSRPENLNWPDVGVEVVVEASRYFSRGEMEAQHDGGRITVLMTGDLRDSVPDLTLVLGINHERFDRRTSVVCVGSDRTQILCPLMQILVDSFGVADYQLAIHRPPYVWDTPRIVSQPHQPQQIARVIPELGGIGTVYRVDDPQTRQVKMWLDLTTRSELSAEQAVDQLRRGAQRFSTAMHVTPTPPVIAGCTYSGIINETRIKANQKQLWIEIECDPVVSYVERMMEVLDFVRRVRS